MVRVAGERRCRVERGLAFAERSTHASTREQQHSAGRPRRAPARPLRATTSVVERAQATLSLLRERGLDDEEERRLCFFWERGRPAGQGRGFTRRSAAALAAAAGTRWGRRRSVAWPSSLGGGPFCGCCFAADVRATALCGDGPLLVARRPPTPPYRPFFVAIFAAGGVASILGVLGRGGWIRTPV